MHFGHVAKDKYEVLPRFGVPVCMCRFSVHTLQLLLSTFPYAQYRFLLCEDSNLYVFVGFETAFSFSFWTSEWR